MARVRIAAVPGDGIGNEVLPAATRVVDAALAITGDSVDWTWLDWGCDYLVAHGLMMPTDGIAQLADHEAIFLGAVGRPDVPDHESLWGLLIPIRRAFDQYVNLRPVKLFPGIAPRVVLPPGADIDMVIIRENTEGEYSSVGGRMFQGTENEMAVQEAVFTRKGVDRVLKFAFEFASKGKKKHVTSATKSNGIIHTMPFWDERFAEMKKNYPDIKADQYHIDILTAHFVRNPDWFDVVVGSNLFGDILSDLGPALTGSIGVAPSGNINPERKYPSMFEPVHGSAPDIAGKGIANPIGQIWSGAMMVRHLGYPEAAEAIERAIAASLVEGGPRTRDLGGNGDTKTVGAAIAELVKTV